jgi:hypothetical protein
MESENHRLRRQIADLQYENTYMRKITEMFKYPSRLREHFIRNNKCAKK